jgi:hypothetical protein
MRTVIFSAIVASALLVTLRREFFRHSFERNADVTENRGAQAGGPILEGLAARSYPVLRM